MLAILLNYNVETCAVNSANVKVNANHNKVFKQSADPFKQSLYALPNIAQVGLGPMLQRRADVQHEASSFVPALTEAVLWMATKSPPRLH